MANVTTPASNDAWSFLPLKPVWFHILLALREIGPAHGGALRRRVEERTGGTVPLYPATLYGSIRELSDTGLIRPATHETPDQRRQDYSLTPLGGRVLEAEADRLASLVEAVRAAGTPGPA